MKLSAQVQRLQELNTTIHGDAVRLRDSLSAMQEQWVLDATIGCRDGLFCFCPIEGDISGDYNIIVGMNVISDKPPGRLVAIVHADGQEAVEAFCEKYAEELLTF